MKRVYPSWNNSGSGNDLIVLCLLATAAAVMTPIGSPVNSAESHEPQVRQPNQHSQGSGSSGDLSKRLNQSDGVIEPPENVDPGMQVKPPPSSDKMPVIPPPGGPGGDHNIRP